MCERRPPRGAVIGAALCTEVQEMSRELDLTRHDRSAKPTRIQRLAAALPERYIVEREIGEGGAAYVLLARDTERGEHVAIKILRPEMATVIGERRFLREIGIIQQFKHPNIVPLLDHGTVSGLIFFTSPFIKGDTLKERIKRKRKLPLADVVSIISDVAAGLDHAHSRGIIHRDVKPANILLADTGTVIADFGIARAVAVENADAITISGVALGTPEYMAPEQCGAMKELDPRCDVYALGCVVHEMLIGAPPFTGKSDYAVINMQLTATARPMRELDGSIPERVDHVVAKALSKARAHRYRSAGEFFDALDAAARV